MQGYFAVFGPGSRAARDQDMARIIAPGGSTAISTWRGTNSCVAAYAGSAQSFRLDGDPWRIWFAGELPGAESPPWQAIARAVSTSDAAFLGRLNGWFSILLIHEPSGRTWAFSDRRAQQPLFHRVDADALYLSTAASSFCRLPNAPAFDPGWLHESIYFNHPVLDRSFLSEVSRVPPATIMTWQPGDREFSRRSWSGPFARAEHLVAAEEADALEQATFAAVSADHFSGGAPIAAALTAGFDARASLAAAPRCTELKTYTYGLPGCADMRDAAFAAARLGIDHLPVELGDEFAERVADHMVAAVRDSDGLERVLRAELVAVYPALAAAGRSIVVGGVSGDHLFRDHIMGTGNVPHLVSPMLMGFIQGRGTGLDTPVLREMYGQRSEQFVAHVGSTLARVDARHGDLRCPEGYLRYLVYENAPKHFGGEAALASNYLRFRTPYWDPRMVGLAFSTERGTLGLSEQLKQKDKFVEATTQASVIRSGLVYGGGTIRGVRVSTWARGNRTRYRIENTLARGKRFVASGFRRPHMPGLLAWPRWLAGPAAPLCAELLGPQARLRAYLDEAFLDRFDPGTDLRLAGRLLSAELVLRLVEQGWPKDYRVEAAT